jgi:hypothetical protein
VDPSGQTFWRGGFQPGVDPLTWPEFFSAGLSARLEGTPGRPGPRPVLMPVAARRRRPAGSDRRADGGRPRACRAALD